MFEMKKLVLAVIIGFLFSACSKKGDYETVFSNPEQYSKTVGLLTQVITHDIFSPPVASRIYAYSSIAAYEVIASQSDENKPLSGKIAGLSVSAANKPVNKEFSAILAYMYIGKELTFSKDSTTGPLRAIKSTFLCLRSLRKISINHGTRGSFCIHEPSICASSGHICSRSLPSFDQSSGAGNGAG
jgi:hypothetical protein